MEKPFGLFPVRRAKPGHEGRGVTESVLQEGGAASLPPAAAHFLPLFKSLPQIAWIQVLLRQDLHKL